MVTFKDLDCMFENILDDFIVYDNDLKSILKIRKAYLLAKKMHRDTKRKSGEPYLIHPIEVAKLAVLYKMDCDTICACLLHDIVEDTECTLMYISKEFGEDVANIVDGVTKITAMDFKDEIGKEELFAKTVRKIFTGLLYKDIRIIAVKLFDRVHNMRTLESMPTQKQIQKANETLEVFAPLAKAIGANKIKKELEDISMKYKYPDIFLDLQNQLDYVRDKSMVIVDRTKEIISEELYKNSIEHKIKTREKNIYNVYISLKKGRQLNNIHDLFALQIDVDDIPKCYTTLGIIHQYIYNNNYKYNPERFKDYITLPKTTGYRALHTTVMVELNQLIQAQIRTHEMAITNSRGILDHLKKYSEHDLALLKRNYPFFSKGIELDKAIENDIDFFAKLKYEVLGEKIYIRNPKGRTEELPVGATLFDYAFLTAPALAAKIKNAEINGQQYTLDEILANSGIALKTDDHIDIEYGTTPQITEECLDKCAMLRTRKLILDQLDHNN